MGERFRKFVESGTDCRYVPLGSRCGLCKKRLGFFATGFWSMNAGWLSDGALCAPCHEKIGTLIRQKRQWMTAAQKKLAPWNQFSSRNWQEMTMAQAEELLALKEAADESKLAGHGEGAIALFRVQQAFQIAPEPLQVGVARAKKMKNRMVVLGVVDQGDFGKGDVVRVDSEGKTRRIAVLEAYVDDRANRFEQLLFANMGRQRISEDQTGWLVLDMEWGVFEGDRIFK